MNTLFTESMMMATLDRVQNSSDIQAGDKACVAFLFGFVKGQSNENKELKLKINKLQERNTPQNAIEKACTNHAICPRCRSTLKGFPHFCGNCGQKVCYQIARS